MTDKAKVILVFVLLVLLFSILTLVFWDFVRDVIIVPIYYLLWEISLVLNSIPGGIYLALLAFLGVVIGFNTLTSLRAERHTKHLQRGQPKSGTRYLHWKNICTHMEVNPFTRERFTGEARKLILSVFAYEQGVDVADAEALILDGKVAVPETIRNLIVEKRLPFTRLHISRVTRMRGRLRRRFFKAEAENESQIDALVGEIISYIEQHLEINHAGNQPESWR